MTKKIMVIGSTGLVGQTVVQQALNDARIDEVICLIRKARPAPANPKQKDVVVDFSKLLSPEIFKDVDALICCIGTTIKIAKTAEAFREVDLHIPTRLAQAGALAGLKCFVLNSSTMANPKARGLYLRTKGQVEQAVINSHIPSVVIARPGLLDGPRTELRFAEEIGIKMTRLINPLLPKRIRSVKVDKLAKLMLEQALLAPKGVTVLESEAFQ